MLYTVAADSPDSTVSVLHTSIATLLYTTMYPLAPPIGAVHDNLILVIETVSDVGALAASEYVNNKVIIIIIIMYLVQ